MAKKRKAKRLMGRPREFTPEAAQEIIDAMRGGCYETSAAAGAGICHKTLYNWKRYGYRAEKAAKKSGRPISAADQPFVNFLHAIKAADARGENRHVVTITMASKEHWQASAWFLERKYPKRWARTDRHQLSGLDGKPIQTDGKVSMGLTPETAAFIRAHMLGLGQEDPDEDDDEEEEEEA